MNELIFYTAISIISSAILWFLEKDRKLFDIFGIILCGLVFAFLCALFTAQIPQNEIKNIVEIDYKTISISDDGSCLFVITDEQNIAINDFEVKFVDKSSLNSGKLVRITTISNELMFPNNILVSTNFDSENYVYYTNLIK